MKRSLVEDAQPRKKHRIEIEHELEDEDSNSSITTPDLLSDEESRYASALLGDVELPEKLVSGNSDPELEKPIVELETALASINQAMAEESQKMELDVPSIERSVNELATVLAPMAEKAQSEVLESQVDINLPDIERSVSEITNALAPMAKDDQFSEQPLKNQGKLNVPEIERSVTELVSVLVPISQDAPTSAELKAKKRTVELDVPETERSGTKLSDLVPVSLDPTTSGVILENKPPLKLNVPEIERSVSELATVLTSFDPEIGNETQPSKETFDNKAKKTEVSNQLHEEEQDHKEEEQKVRKLKLAHQTHTYELPSLPTNPPVLTKEVLPLDGHVILSVEDSPALVDPLSELPQLPCVDSITATPSPQHEIPKTLNTEKFASLPFLTKSSRQKIAGTLSIKTDTKNKGTDIEVKTSTSPQQNLPEEETTETSGAPASSSPSLRVNSHAASTDIKCKEVVLRALKEDLVRAYKAVLKVDGGGISDEKLGSLLLWLGIPEVSVNKHVRRIVRRKRKSGKPSRQTSLKNILRYLNYVFA